MLGVEFSPRLHILLSQNNIWVTFSMGQVYRCWRGLPLALPSTLSKAPLEPQPLSDGQTHMEQYAWLSELKALRGFSQLIASSHFNML